MDNLSPQVEQCLEIFADAAKDAFADELVSIILFGSAATGDMRSTSDVNLLLVLRRFEKQRADHMREPLRVAHAAVQMNVMFLLEAEVAAATEAFAVKFSDIIARHRLLFGTDPFSALHTSRAALLTRVRQVLLNLQLRLRERYVSLSLREEQLVQLIADAAPPLRASAASILQLEGQSEPSAKIALEHIASELQAPYLTELLQTMSQARESGKLPPGVASPAVMGLIDLTQSLRERAALLQ